jgi:hypothetical protein
VHVEPLAAADSKLTIGAVVGYADGPRADAGVPRASTFSPGSAIAASPAPTQPADRYEGVSRAYEAVDVVVVPDAFVVPSAYADAAPIARTSTQRRMSEAPRRIAPVCRTFRRLARPLT